MVFIVALGEVLRFPFFYGVSPWRFFFFYVIFPQWMKIIIHFRNFPIVDYMSVVPLLLQCKCGGLSHSNAKYHLHRWEKKIIAKSTYDKIQHYKIINKNKYICLLLRLSAFFVCIFLKKISIYFLRWATMFCLYDHFFACVAKKILLNTPRKFQKYQKNSLQVVKMNNFTSLLFPIFIDSDTVPFIFWCFLIFFSSSFIHWIQHNVIFSRNDKKYLQKQHCNRINLDCIYIVTSYFCYAILLSSIFTKRWRKTPFALLIRILFKMYMFADEREARHSNRFYRK